MIGWVAALSVGLQNGCFDYFHTGLYHNVIDFGSIGLTGKPVIGTHLFSIRKKNSKRVHHLNPKFLPGFKITLNNFQGQNLLLYLKGRVWLDSRMGLDNLIFSGEVFTFLFLTLIPKKSVGNLRKHPLIFAQSVAKRKAGPAS